MPNVRLSENCIEAFESRKFVYDIRDSDLKGFGIRVLSSGSKHFFVHNQHEGRSIWKTIDDSGSIGLEEARPRATAFLAAIRREDEMSALPEDRLVEAVAEEVFDRYGRNWKPRSLEVNRTYLRRKILPWFGGRNIACRYQRVEAAAQLQVVREERQVTQRCRRRIRIPFDMNRAAEGVHKTGKLHW